jgi:hypothetical protein
MSVPKFLSKTALHSFAAVLAASVTVSLTMSSIADAQMVGPQQPQPRPTQENAVTKAISKFMKSKKTSKEGVEETQDAAGNQSDEDTSENGSEKLKVTEPLQKPRANQPSTESMKHPPLLNQPPLTNARIEAPQIDEQNPPVLSHPRLDDPTNPLGFADAETKLRKFITLVDAKRYNEAKPGLLQLRQWLVDLTEAHIGLFKTLNQVPSARGQAELEKELALQFAQLRDRAMLETAKIYISERDYPKAVKELTEVVKSQPRSKMGLRSYELLQEIGFTEKLQLTQ